MLNKSRFSSCSIDTPERYRRTHGHRWRPEINITHTERLQLHSEYLDLVTGYLVVGWPNLLWKEEGVKCIRNEWTEQQAGWTGANRPVPDRGMTELRWSEGEMKGLLRCDELKKGRNQKVLIIEGMCGRLIIIQACRSVIELLTRQWMMHDDAKQTYSQRSCGPQTSAPHQWEWQGRKVSGPPSIVLCSSGSTWRSSRGPKSRSQFYGKSTDAAAAP